MKICEIIVHLLVIVQNKKILKKKYINWILMNYQPFDA